MQCSVGEAGGELEMSPPGFMESAMAEEELWAEKEEREEEFTKEFSLVGV